VNRLEIDTSPIEEIDCPICGAKCDSRDRICDGCWYGMRLSPEEWKKDLKSRGIKVVRGLGCGITSFGFVCGDSYKAAPTQENS